MPEMLAVVLRAKCIRQWAIISQIAEQCSQMNLNLLSATIKTFLLNSFGALFSVRQVETSAPQNMYVSECLKLGTMTHLLL